MAAIITDEDFQMAAGQWSDENPGAFQGTPYPNKAERKLYDETPNPNPPPGVLYEDVTPPLAALEAALDRKLAAMAKETEREEARQLLLVAKEYIRTQLESDNPSTAQQQVAVLSPYAVGVNSNAFITKRMTKLIGLANTAYGHTPALTITPAAQPHFSRWLEVFIQMVSIET